MPGIILGAFYYGYMVFQIPGGWLALRLGGARLFGAAVLVASVFTLMTPFATRWSPVALILLRILEGLVLVSVLYTEKKRCDNNKTFYIYCLEREREREKKVSLKATTFCDRLYANTLYKNCSSFNQENTLGSDEINKSLKLSNDAHSLLSSPPILKKCYVCYYINLYLME